MDSDVLPTFFAVGAAKAGTTSLYRYLGSHPEIFVSPVKEPFFFSFMDEDPHFEGPHDDEINQDIITDPHRYRRLFDEATAEQERGEFSNSYLYFLRSAPRIREWVPDAKILIMLRDPVRRAFSHYLQGRMLGHEHLSFEEALAREEKREAQNWRWHYQYRDQSRYAEAVQTYLDRFGREQVHVVIFDDFVTDTRQTVRQIARFLGVNEDFYDSYEFSRHNETVLPRSEVIHTLFQSENVIRKIARALTPLSFRRWMADFVKSLNYGQEQKPTLDPDTEMELQKEFRADVKQLEDLIGRDLTAWKELPK
jgi:hypothetical protein